MLALLVLTVFIMLCDARCAWAQRPMQGSMTGYQPFHQMMPPGMAGFWAGAAGRVQPGYFQPVRIDLPTAGSVTVYFGPNVAAKTLKAPAQFGAAVGHVYRLRIADMPEYPRVELFPSIEILDRLHPPTELIEKFPVPVEFTADEIENAIRGRLVTKVIYLEQPQLAKFPPSNDRIPVETIPSDENLMAAADLAGRPMIIVRMGSRMPDPRGMEPVFFGPGAPIVTASNGTDAEP